jgi:NitT/TauT family transport system substrate-binding protein
MSERTAQTATWSLSLCAALLAVLSGCGQTAPTGGNSGAPNHGVANANGSATANGTASAAAGLTKVTLATLPVADSALVVLAEKQGIFQKNGIDVKLDIVQTGPATTSAVVSGAAQFSQSNYATLFQARSQGVPIEIVAEAANAAPHFSYVVTTPDSPIKSPKDLSGKRIATSVIGGIGPVAIDYWLQQNGIDYKTIQWVQMPFQDMGAALQRHQVDAAWVVEPFSTQLTNVNHDKVVFDVFSGPTAGMPVAAYATSENYAKAHPEVVAAFRKSLEEAATVAVQNPSAIREILPSYTSLSPTLANQIALETYPQRTDVNEIKKVAEAMNATGFLKAGFDPASMVWSGN